MKKYNVPDEIVDALVKLERKEKLLDDEKIKLDSFLQQLEEAIPNPANTAKILVNPIPNEVDVSIKSERNLEDRIRHINTVNARIREANAPQDPAELENFDMIDDSFDMLPRSIFEVRDHTLSPTVPEVLEPIVDMTVPNPDVEVPVDLPAE